MVTAMENRQSQKIEKVNGSKSQKSGEIETPQQSGPSELSVQCFAGLTIRPSDLQKGPSY
jgi:hypothetical protein